MPQEQKPIDPKKAQVKAVISWVFDIIFLGSLIFYFSLPGKTEFFWSSATTWFCRGTTKVFHLVSATIHNGAPTTSGASRPALSSPPPPMFVPPPLPTKEQLAKETGGDCYPPEARSAGDAAAVSKLFYEPPPIAKVRKPRKLHGKPIAFVKKKIKGVPFYQLTIDLTDPETYLVIRLPHDSQQANSTTFSAGHEAFETFVKRSGAAAMVNGTFFSKDDQERVMGNMVSEGKSLKYSPWENYGTTLGLKEQNVPEMITARAEGQPDWSSHWFSLTCGPRLVKQGEVWVNPELEGFTDSHVLGVGPRSAIGFPITRDKLFIIVFQRGLSLTEEAKLMQEIGCYEAMNIDGGASKALAQGSSIVVKPGRGLTNVLAVYDSKHKAPNDVIESWRSFQHSEQ
jgi:hypothetical protein